MSPRGLRQMVYPHSMPEQRWDTKLWLRAFKSLDEMALTQGGILFRAVRQQ